VISHPVTLHGSYNKFGIYSGRVLENYSQKPSHPLPDWPCLPSVEYTRQSPFCTRQRICRVWHSVKKVTANAPLSSVFFSGTRQSLCRVSKSTRQIFRNQIRKTVFKNSKTFYFYPIITPRVASSTTPTMYYICLDSVLILHILY